MLKFLAFIENPAFKRIPCIQRHSKIFAFSRNPAFNGKGFLPFTANRKIWHSVKILQRISCGFRSAEFLAFRGNPKQSFRVQKLRNFWHSAEIERGWEVATACRQLQTETVSNKCKFCLHLNFGNF